MALPSLTLRNTKGSALTFSEMDANLTNLQSATLTVSTATTGTAIGLNGEIVFAAGSGMTVSESSGTITYSSTALTAISQDGDPTLGSDLNTTGYSVFSNSDLNFVTNGGGNILMRADLTQFGDGGGTDATLTTYQTGDLILNTNEGTNSGSIRIYDGANGNITLTPNGSGAVQISKIDVAGGEIDGVTIGTNSPVTALQVDDIKIDGSTISTQASNGSVTVASSGTGNIYLQSDQMYVGRASGQTQFISSDGDDFVLQSMSSTGTVAAVFRLNSVGNIVISPASGYQVSIGNDYWPVSGGTQNQFIVHDSGNATSWSNTLKGYNEGSIYDLGTTGGTIAPNCANGNVQKITLNSALTINGFTSAVAGQSVTLIIYGGTSYTSITSTMKFAGGDKDLTGTSGCIDILTIYYDGTTYFASLNKGFA